MMKVDEKRMAALDAHLKQWQAIAERVRAQMAPALEMQEAIQRSLEPMIEAQRTFEKGLGPILVEQKPWAVLAESTKFPRFELPDLSQLTRRAAELQESWRGAISPAFELLQETFRELPLLTKKALLLLGDHGWYLDLEMTLPELWELKEALSEGNAAKAEEALVAYFEGRLDEIEKSITERFPHRAHLIRAAFNAHRRQEYELSVPVLLAQTDGMCKDAVNQYLFIRQNKKPGTAVYVERVAADTFRAALLSPLARTLPISASEHERPAGADTLNRHAVLHGESLNYGNKTNSLRAISLINYVAHVLEVENESHRQGASADAPEAPRR
jgi:hypothetical protein